MRYPLLHLMVFLLFAMSTSLIAQEYSFVNFTTKDGLAGSTVYDAVQDKDGFMWFATENGLSRFDGKTFRNYTVSDGLPDNEILKLFVDSKNRVWIMPFCRGIAYYYKGKIISVKTDSLLMKLKIGNHINNMFEDKHGNLLISEARGAYHILDASGAVTTYEHDVGNESWYSFFTPVPGIDENGEIRLFKLMPTISNKKNYGLVWPITKRTLQFRSDPNIAPITRLSLNYREAILYAIRPDVAKLNHFSLRSLFDDSLFLEVPENTICINWLKDKRISINTSNGAFFFDILKKTKSPYYLKNFLINNVFIDNENNYWYCTKGSGIVLIPSIDFMNIDQTHGDEVTAFAEDSDNIVFAGGSKKTIYKINKTDNSIKLLPFPKKDSAVLNITAFLKVNSKLLISTDRHIYDEHFEEYASIECPKSLWNSPNGILVSTCFGVLKRYVNGITDTILSSRSTCSVEKDSGYYIGTLEGLCFVSQNKVVTAIGKKFPVLQSRIVNLAVSGDSILWITTKGHGVCGYKNGKIIYEFNESNGLSNNDCSCIYADPNSNSLWVGTARGLNHIIYTNGKYSITKYSSSDGLMSDNITAVLSTGDKVFVGTPGGVSFFVPEKIRQQSSCNLVITGIYVNDSYYAYDTTNFSLSHDNNNIRFEFCGISLKSGGEMFYEYKLAGLHDNWRKINNNSLSFTTLPSGHYTLQLKAINKYGVESKVREITFEIRQLLWEKWWFKLLVSVALGGLIWIAWHYRIKSIKKKNDEKARISNRIAELEQTALRAQMNPHFIFNCLNSIQQYVAERDIHGANRFITDFSKVIRMTLDMSSRHRITLRDELDYLHAYLQVEKARMEGGFDFSIEVEEFINTDEIYLPPLLLQPFVENSIRHGIKYLKGKGVIKIFVKKTVNDAVLVILEDNGIGRKNAEQFKSKYHVEYQSKGMAITSDRIELNNQVTKQQIRIEIEDLSDFEMNPSGTRINIYLIRQE